MTEAARFGDGIGHSHALAGMILGTLLGAAVIALVTVATAGAGGLILAAVAGTLAAAGGAAVRDSVAGAGAAAVYPTGTVNSSCSADVFIDGRPAATAVEWKEWTVDLSLARKKAEPEKYGFSAGVLLKREVENGWSKVTLRVMLDAAQQAGVMFNDIKKIKELELPEDLLIFCEKAIAAGRAVRGGQKPVAFTPEEIQQIAKKYIHCSANWGSPELDKEGKVHGEPSLSNFSLSDQPDNNWIRTVYDMNGDKL